MEPIADTFDAAFSKTVDLANKMADKDKDADLWDIADGLLAGAIIAGVLYTTVLLRGREPSTP